MEQIRHREEREVCLVFQFCVGFAWYGVCFILDFVSSFCCFDMLHNYFVFLILIGFLLFIILSV